MNHVDDGRTGLVEARVPAVTNAGAGLVVTTASRLDALVGAMADELSTAGADPFAMHLAVTPGPAHQRYISQTIARTNGYGVCAGVEFASVSSLRRRLADELAGPGLPHPDEDPWSTAKLSRIALRAFGQVAGESWAAPLTNHLLTDEQRPGRRLATGRRIARLAQSYCRDAPAMIDAWDGGHATGPDGAPLEQGYRWQGRFWQVLCGMAEAPHPLAQHRELLTRVAQSRPTAVPVTVHLLVVDSLHPQDVELVSTLGRVCTVKVWQLDHSAPPGPAVLQRLASVHRSAMTTWGQTDATIGPLVTPASAERSSSVLRGLQAAVHGDRLPGIEHQPVADSLRFLPSHGPNRQVEVLRDYLCGLLEDDPTLEPRDIAVLCPNLNEFAPVLDAAMVASPVTEDAHPGHWLRVSVSHDQARQPNEVLSLIDRVLAMRSARATWEDLFDLCLSTPVATRWGFDGDGGQALKQLITKADIRWGLDRTHRNEFGISYDRGTWLAGVEALTLGSALADSPLVSLRSTVPAGYLDSQETARAGQLAEFVSRIRKFFHECQPAPAAVWNDRLQGLISDVVGMPRPQRWQVAAARNALARWAGPERDEAELGRADVRQVIAEMSREQRVRPSFGTGALVVSGLRDLTGIPHRVVAVLGLDDKSFPRRGQTTGDDLLAGRVRPGVPHPREVDQQHLLNAVMAATDKFVVTYQAQDPTSLDTMDQPVPVSELRAATAVAGHVVPDPVGTGGRGILPAQPFSRSNYLATDAGDDADQRPFSFDQRSFRAFAHEAGVETHPDWKPQDLLLHDFPPAAHPAVLRLQDLTQFFRHPIKAFLDQRAGLKLGRFNDSPPTSITLEANQLNEWNVKNTVLDRLRQGEDLATLMEHQRWSRHIPPTEAGTNSVNKAASAAAGLAERLAADTRRATLVAVDLMVPHPAGAIRLVGAVPARGDEHLLISAAGPNGASLLEAWINALALACATGRPPKAVIEEPRSPHALTAAVHESPMKMLENYVRLYVHGLTHPLAAPPKTLWQAHESPRDPWRAKGAWDRERDASWARFAARSFDQFMDQTTCAAGPQGTCQRIAVASLVGPLFGAVSHHRISQ